MNSQPATSRSERGYTFISQFIASIRKEADANIAFAEKAAEEDVPRLQASIDAKQQVSASFMRQIAAIQKQWRKNEKNIEVDQGQVKNILSNLAALKAQDPFERIRNLVPPRELIAAAAAPKPGSGTSTYGSNVVAPQPEQDVLQYPEQAPSDGDEVEVRPAKRRRTADDNELTERTVDFDAVYANGQPTHLIVEHPKKSRNWYIFECQKHARLFNSKPLLGAMHHAHGKGHGVGRSAESAIKELGSRILGCDVDRAKQNNAAFNPKIGLTAGPRLSEVFHPKPGKLLARGAPEAAGPGLLNGNIPPCYKVEDERIVGWETGYGDDGVARQNRRFPLLWLQANVHFTFRDGKLQVPLQQRCFSWLHAAQLRPFHSSGPDGKPVEIPEAVREFFQPPVSDQAPLANMNWDNQNGSTGIIVVDDDSDKDYDDEAGQTSEEDEEDEDDDEDDDDEEEEEEEDEEEDEEDDMNGLHKKPKDTGPGVSGVARAGVEPAGPTSSLESPLGRCSSPA